MRPPLSITLHPDIYLTERDDCSGEKMFDDFCICIAFGDRSEGLIKLSDLFQDCVDDADQSDNYMDMTDVMRFHAISRRAKMAAVAIEGKFLRREATFICEEKETAGTENKAQGLMIAAGADILRRAGVTVPAAVILAVYEGMVVAGANCIDNQLHDRTYLDDEVQS